VRSTGRPDGDGDGDGELAISTRLATVGDQDLAIASSTDGEDEVVRTKNRARPSNVVLLLAAILVATLANMVVAWFVLGSTTQVRDQYTIANGLQRCLIRAQLAENSTTDPNGTAYKAAVTACINK
jgi:hypothetical protein